MQAFNHLFLFFAPETHHLFHSHRPRCNRHIAVRANKRDRKRKGRISRDGYLSEQQPGDQVTDADGDKSGDEAGELEGMVDDKLTDAGGTCPVKTDSGNLRRVVGQEEIAVDSREEGEQYMRRHAKRQADRVQGLRRGCLREEHDAE